MTEIAKIKASAALLKMTLAEDERAFFDHIYVVESKESGVHVFPFLHSAVLQQMECWKLYQEATVIEQLQFTEAVKKIDDAYHAKRITAQRRAQLHGLFDGLTSDEIQDKYVCKMFDQK